MVRDQQWGPDQYYRSGWPAHPAGPERPVALPTETSHHDLPFAQHHDARLHDFVETRPIDVGRALRDYCRIPAKHYFVSVINDDGSVMKFAGPDGLRDQNVFKKFFNEENFVRCMQRHNPMLQEEPDYAPTDTEFGRFPVRRRPDRNFGDDLYYQPKASRKRVKVNLRDDDDSPMPVVAAKREIQIGKKEEVLEYYAQQFRNLQQTACKLIAKAWVKQVEPKKQSVHPYTGAESKAPDWWPKAWGPTKDEKVRHKEPDHLYKRERVHLLCHILRLVVQPNDEQHHAIKQLNLSVKKLQESAHEALTMFFNDKDGNNKAKKPYLDYLFNMARQEERFLRGEIDAEHKVYVLKDDRASTDNYGDEGETEHVKAEDEPTQVSPPKTATAAAPHGMLASVTHGQSPTRSNMPGTFGLNDLPVRGPQYTHAMPGPEQAPFMEDGSLGVPATGQIAIPPTPHDGSRRSSIFQSPADYHSPSVPPNMYQPWTGGTTAPTTQPLYSFTQNSPNHHVPFVAQGIQSSQAPYMPPVDGLPRGYDPNQGSMFNPGSFSQPGVSQQPADYNYPIDPRSVPGTNVKVDHLGRGPPMA
ncbi:uncharacterized protein MKZ38_006522 [Zalerion maritima]|uniref:Subtelomeric hrmA-associated cluster protein AFUB-079030/YDR124W-like helical bundle domain-containing protein n=1 Tax=Zalerion maritima TaxID=339359 RepID=A0AAD5WYR5_9PEZI|nr:uncharacterized protein MKZ38_006522 [Zalerion maritima]